MGQRFFAVVVVIASACTALHFSSSEHASVVVSPTSHHFPGPGSATFTLSPKSGTGHDVLQSISMSCASQWTLDTSFDPQQPVLGASICGTGSGSGSSVPAATGENVDQALPCPRNYQFRVYYAGTLPGVDSCDVVITTIPYYGGGTEVLTLPMSGSGSAAQGIKVSPDAINFGSVPTGRVATSMVNIKNIGTTTVSVTGSLVGDSAFGVSPGYTSFSLNAGSDQTFNVTCTPAAVGAVSGTLTFASGSSASNVGLACNGILSTIDINPRPVVFASTLVGRPPAQKTVTITPFSGSAGSGTLESVTLDSDAIAAGVTIVTNPQGMSVGSGKNIVLGYSAATEHASGSLGALVVKVSTDAMAQDVAISGEALRAGVGTNPASVDFGGVCVGGKGMKDIEVYANEAGDVTLQQMAKPAAPFDAMLMDTLPKQLGGNHSGVSATARATFEPTEPGDFKDAIALTSNVPNMGTTEIQLQGVGLAAGIAATPTSVHFGIAQTGTTTSIKEVQFSNCGDHDLMFDRAYISGPDALEFTLIGTNPAKALKPTESVVFMVVMQPDSTGLKAAKLVIEHADGTTMVDLDGTGEGGGGKQRETYYACSTGKPASLWPLALALLAVRRRRRR